MDLLLLLTYVALAYLVFKIFKIPVNKWSIPTAALGGICLVGGLVLLMNYNHPYTEVAQKAVIAIPIVPQVTGVVIEVISKKNQLIKKGEILFTLDPSRYQSRLDRLSADLVTAEQSYRALINQLQGAQATTEQVRAERDRVYSEYQRYVKGSKAKVNPFSDRDIDTARQNYLAEDARLKAAFAGQQQIKTQLDGQYNGEHSQLASLNAQIAEAKYDLAQTVIRAPSDGYATQVLIQPGTYAAALPLRPVMVFIPSQVRQMVAVFRQNSLLRLKSGDDAEIVFDSLPGKVYPGKLVTVIPVISGGAYQAQGTLQTINTQSGNDGVMATIEFASNNDIDSLPDGVYGQVAIYSKHFSHVSVMRKILLRMTSWMHYLYLDH